MTIYNVVMIKVSIDSDFVDPVCLLVLMEPCNVLFSVNCRLGAKYYWVNWQHAVSHRPKQKHTFQHGTHISK